MPRLEREIEALPRAVARRAIERLYTMEPETTAVLLTGSYAKGTAALASDLDLIAITPSPRVGYRTWFEEETGDAPLQVSAAATTADTWRARATSPARGSFGFPAIDVAAYLSTDERTRAQLGDDPSLRRPAADPSSRTSSSSC